MRFTILMGLCALAGCSEWTIRGQGDGDSDDDSGAEPIADAGDDIETVPLTDLRLDGTASSDPENLQITGYRWTLASAPETSTAQLSNADDDRPFFFVDVAGEYAFDLTVQNSRDLWDSTPDRVVLDASPDASLYVQLTWDTEADLDLHLVQGNAPLYSTPGDTCWCNRRSDWGAVDVEEDDGVLVTDTTLGFGPEVVSIDSPAEGSYHIIVHYYGIDGRGCDDVPCPATTATIRAFVNGVEVQTLEQPLTAAGEVWRAATALWPAATVTPANLLTSTAEFTCF